MLSLVAEREGELGPIDLILGGLPGSFPFLRQSKAPWASFAVEGGRVGAHPDLQGVGSWPGASTPRCCAAAEPRDKNQEH